MRPEVQVLLGPLVCSSTYRLPGVITMKKLLALAVAAAGIVFALKKKKGQSSTDVWKDATRSES
jgi:hypothetical protein